MDDAQAEGAVIATPNLRSHFDLGAGVLPLAHETLRRHEKIAYEEADGDDD